MREESQSSLLSGRDDKTRTCDLAPPRRVRYQLRYIPLRSILCLQRYAFFLLLANFSVTLCSK